MQLRSVIIAALLFPVLVYGCTSGVVRREFNAERIADIERLIREAVSYQTAGRHEPAIKAYQTALVIAQKTEVSLNVSVIHSGLAYSYAELQRWQDALAAAEEALRVNQDNAGTRFITCVALNHLGRFEDAIGECKHAIQLEPEYGNYYETYANLGLAYWSLNRWEEAAAAYEQALRIRPSPDAYTGLGFAYANLQRLEDALQAFVEVTRLAPDSPEANYLVGATYTDLRRFDKAVPFYEQTIRLKPDHAEAHRWLGIVLEILGRHADALEAFTRAAELTPDDAEIYSFIGETYRNLGRFEQAVDSYRNALRLKPDQPETLVNLGDVYERLGLNDERIEVLTRATQMDPALPEAHYGLGAALLAAGRSAEAVGCLRRAIELRPDYAEAHYILGLTYRDLDRSEEAVEETEQAARLKPDFTAPHLALGLWHLDEERYQQATEALTIAARPDSDLGAWLRVTAPDDENEPAQALVRYQQERASAKNRKNKPAEAEALVKLARAYDALGDTGNARDHLVAAARLYQSVPAPAEEAEVLRSLGDLERDGGQYNEALRLYHKALEAARKAAHKGEAIGEAFTSIGDLHDWIGNAQAARDYYQRALETATAADDKLGTLRSVSRLRSLAASLGRVEEFTEWEHQLAETLASAHLFESAPDEERLTNILKLGELSRHEGQLEAQWGNPAAAVALLMLSDVFHQVSPKTRQFMRERATALYYRGMAHFRLREFGNASADFQEALEIARKMRSPEEYWIVNRMGAIQEAKGKLSEALTLYTEAIDILERIGGARQVPEHRLLFRERTHPVYGDAIRVIAKLWAETGSRRFLSQAFAMHEKGKARTLLELLQDAHVLKPHAGGSSALEEEVAITARMSELRRALEKGTLSRSEEKHLLAALRNQEEALEVVRVKAAGSLGNARVKTSTTATVADVHTILDDDSVLLEYALGTEGSGVWAITRDAVEAYEIPAEPEIRELVEGYLPTLRAPLYGDDEIGEHLALGRRLYRALVQPAVSQLDGKRRLIIVPDGILHYVPFETLVAQDHESTLATKHGPASASYLVKNYTITYAPSASVLLALEQEHESLGAEPDSGQAPLLAFGDPAYGSGSGSGTEVISLRRAFENRGGRFARLEHSAGEVKRLARLYGLDIGSDAINLGTQVTEKRLRNMDLTRYRVLHFAVHAILDDAVKWITQPALVLSLEGNEEPYDGFLQMREIVDLRLNADLVVLSACDTARGRLHRGEGVVGLSSAFLYAGSRSVVSSLWKVHDESTSLFMELFYGNLVNGLPEAEALRQAKLQMIGRRHWLEALGQEQSLASPYFWAPFVLIGGRD
jgi:tetratricopeptide (TPR) repeat protein